MAVHSSLPKANSSDLSALYDGLANFAINEASRPPTTNIQPALPNGTFTEKLGAANLMQHEIEMIEKGACRGAKLQLAMVSDNVAAGKMLGSISMSAASQFQDIQDLEASGYIEKTDPDSSEKLTWVKIGMVLSQIGMDPAISSEPGIDGPAPVHHQCQLADYCSPDGTHHYPAFAHFMQIINPKEGLIVAYDNLSPIGADREAGRNGGPLPYLKFWSDVVFLQWKSRATLVGLDKNLKYVLRYQVMNDTTELVVEAINEANRTKTDQWPGITYDAASVEGHALLGTPNGSSVAYLLAQHKQALGHKTVDKITVFREARDLMLLFHVVDVAPSSEIEVVAKKPNRPTSASQGSG